MKGDGLRYRILPFRQRRQGSAVTGHSWRSAVGYMFFGGLLFLYACIEPFETDVPRKNSVLIVEGLLLDDPRHQYVKLFLSSDSSAREPFNFASVSINTRNGDSKPLLLFAPGEYRLRSFDSLAVNAGQEYQLEVLIGDSVRALSAWEKVPRKTEIVAARLEPSYRSYFNQNGILIQQKGVELLASSGQMAADQTHLRWDYEVTYGYVAPLASPLCALCGYCYVTERPRNINVVSKAVDSQGKTLPDQSIDFVEISEKFSLRYSVLVKQFSITAAAYEYYTAIERINNARGSIFDPPPSVISGNITNQVNPESTIYGFFEVGGYSEVSASIQRTDIQFLVPDFYERCFEESQKMPFTAFDCLDCRAREGASTDRPYYY